MCLGVWLSFQSSEQFWCWSRLFWQSCWVFSKVSVQTGAGQLGITTRGDGVFQVRESLCLVMPSVQPLGFSAGTFKAANLLLWHGGMQCASVGRSHGDLGITLGLRNAFKRHRTLVLRAICAQETRWNINEQRQEREIFLAKGSAVTTFPVNVRVVFRETFPPFFPLPSEDNLSLKSVAWNRNLWVKLYI